MCGITALGMAVWYTMQDAGCWDYKNGLLPGMLWLVGMISVAYHCLTQENDDRTQENEKTGKCLVPFGSLAVLAMGIPYLILGKDAIFVYHDQLDGEVIAYLLQARHLWDGSGILPEFMNGASRTALTMPAPACVLLYRLLPAETALACMQVAGSFVGYVGMFLLLWWAAEDSEILSGRKGTVGFLAMTVGCMYAYLPFLPVYGLSQSGLPMLLYCVLRLWERDRSIRDRLLYYAYVVFSV